MRTVQITELSADAFLPFGFYASMIDPESEKLGMAPVEFFRDMVQLDLGSASIASFSTCRVEPREAVIKFAEYHTATGEGILPLDNDVLIHVAPASPPGADIPPEKVKVFRVPQGTMVTLRPGVWHMAPFALGDSPVNVLIVLPGRTYANDCKFAKLEEEIAIDM